MSARTALLTATNGKNDSLLEAPIIQAYMRFERQRVTRHQHEKITVADARKVRWLLIYGTLQYLISALRAPAEVRDVENSKYFLCCLVAEQRQWQAGTNITYGSASDLVDASPVRSRVQPDECGSGTISPAAWRTAIEPDCQNQDYLLHTNTDPGSRRFSVEVPAPLKILQTSRTSSIRSRRRLSFSSIGSRRDGIQPKPQVGHEIPMHDHGNNPYEPVSQTSLQSLSTVTSSACSMVTRSSHSIPGPGTSWLRPSTPEMTGQDSYEAEYFSNYQENTPTMSRTQLKVSNSPDSLSSQDSSLWTDGASSVSSKSSTYDLEPETKLSPGEECGLLGGLVPVMTLSLPTYPNTDLSRDSFQFDFNQQFESSETAFAQAASGATDDESNIGIALAHQPLESTADMSSFPMKEGNAQCRSQAHSPPSLDEHVVERITARTRKPDFGTNPLHTPGPNVCIGRSHKDVALSDVTEDAKAKKERRKSFWRR